MRLRTIVVWVGLLLAVPSWEALAQSAGIREVTASERNLIPLNTKIRFTTMILLPDGEQILDVVCGDRDFWIIQATENIAHVKPAKEGASTNLNLVTASGSVYSFMLVEGKAIQPDLKVYVTADPSAKRNSTPKYVSTAQVSALQTELSAARTAIENVRSETQQALSSFRRQYPAALQFAFGSLKYERPFYVKSIWHDGEFTYIKSDAQELPALYEIKDGQPALVNFSVEQGTYVVPKVLDRGYLALGNARFTFQQQGR
jgi:type IV secretory pathway VirB9-like protein